jgi:hypothetical protein
MRSPAARLRRRITVRFHSAVYPMKSKAPDLELRAVALLKRIQRHNGRKEPLNGPEMGSVLKEVQAIVELSAADSQSADVVLRVDRILKQVIEEAGKSIGKSIRTIH